MDGRQGLFVRRTIPAIDENPIKKGIALPQKLWVVFVIRNRF